MAEQQASPTPAQDKPPTTYAEHCETCLARMSMSKLARVAAFRDDLDSASKVFTRLNSYRRLNGFKEVQWDEILCELAISRSHQLIRNRALPTPRILIAGARFNLGVSYVDVASYIPIEEKDGKQVPVHRTMDKVWRNCSGHMDTVLDPLTKFAAVSVYASGNMVCVTLLTTIMLPSLFSPRMLKSDECDKVSPQRKRRRKPKKGRRRSGECTDSLESDTDADTHSGDFGEVAIQKDDDESMVSSENPDPTCIDMLSLEVNKKIAEDTWLGDQALSEQPGNITVISKDSNSIQVHDLTLQSDVNNEAPVLSERAEITTIDISELEVDIRTVTEESLLDGQERRRQSSDVTVIDTDPGSLEGQELTVMRRDFELPVLLQSEVPTIDITEFRASLRKAAAETWGDGPVYVRS